jgi:hypothetical protein
MSTMLKQEKINQAEKRERKAIMYFEQNHNEFNIEEISVIGDMGFNDFTAYSGRTHIMGEIKIRTFNHDKYPTAVIELDKVNRLMTLNQDNYRLNNTQLWYVAIYPEDKTFLIFDIMNTPMTLTYEYCPKVTMDENSGKTYKTMANFKIEDAIYKWQY